MTGEKTTAEKTTSREASGEPVPKKLRREEKPTNCLDSDMNEDLCYMCFGSCSDDAIKHSGRDSQPFLKLDTLADKSLG